MADYLLHRRFDRMGRLVGDEITKSPANKISIAVFMPPMEQ